MLPSVALAKEGKIRLRLHSESRGLEVEKKGLDDKQRMRGFRLINVRTKSVFFSFGFEFFKKRRSVEVAT